ncbi:hypothetical protein NEILACOT_04227 [Neisseria lactamica ATCC 23970]|uniref:Uncharacterized protein n=1 Tax=Neisseria lactamica ATCC 23970 TaxID=546265 RepID=D0W9L5_NEILA|nr:hypothetical protein NEILACOT_04227 [Neisseria lactamica ATCC 23970]
MGFSPPLQTASAPAVIPAQAGIQTVRFQPFPINSCNFEFLDSHFRGNDVIQIPVLHHNIKTYKKHWSIKQSYFFFFFFWLCQ